MICLVTDRRRLAGAGAPADAARACLIAQARHAADAGVDLIQVRERDLEAGELAALVDAMLAITRGTPTRLVVNDRLDVALACGADGVHLRADSIPIGEARRIAPAGFLIGRSVHGVDEAASSAAADYLIAGTVFASASKPGERRLLGVDGLRAIAAAVDTPVLAIGGIAADCLGEIAAAGARGFAAIALFMASHPDAEAGACRAMDLRQSVKSARSRFDRPECSP